MFSTPDSRKVAQEQLKLDSKKKKLEEELEKILWDVPKKGFFKSTYEISKMELNIRRINIEHNIKTIEQKTEYLRLKFQEAREKQKRIDRANKLIKQMKKYKELIISENDEDVKLEERKIEYYKLFGICESLHITINVADSMYRSIYFENKNEDFLNSVIERIDNNLISGEKYLDIIPFEGSEVFENSCDIDKKELWLNW